eukprot:7696492-Karenia_brevis.AAC.1
MKFAPTWAQKNDEVPAWLRKSLDMPSKNARRHEYHIPTDLEIVAGLIFRNETASGADTTKI